MLNRNSTPACEAPFQHMVFPAVVKPLGTVQYRALPELVVDLVSEPKGHSPHLLDVEEADVLDLCVMHPAAKSRVKQKNVCRAAW